MIFTPPRVRWGIVVLIALLAVGLIIFPGCGTTTPKPPTAEIVAHDGGAQNAGIISLDATGAVITPAKRDYYNALVRIYGDAKWKKGGLPIFAVPLKPDDGVTPKGDNYHITAAALTNLTVMHQWFKMGRTPE